MTSEDGGQGGGKPQGESRIGSSGIASSQIETNARTDRARSAQYVGGQTRAFKAVDYTDRGMRASFRRHRKLFIGVGGALFALFLWWGFQPLKGTVHVGICRTLIQLQVRYPQTLRVTAIEWFKNDLRFYITFIDPFGQDRSEMFECIFNPDLTLSDARVNRVSIGADKVAAFNQTIPALLSANPDLTIAPPPSKDLLGLKDD